MRALIIGGTGILGSAISTALHRAGFQLTLIAKEPTALRPAGGTWQQIIADRKSKPTFAQMLRDHAKAGWDLIVDCICYDADEASALLDALCEHPSHVVMLSTTYVYCEKSPMPYQPSSILAPPARLGGYALGKAEAEQVYLSANGVGGWTTTVIRLPHILGCGCQLGIIPLHNRDPGLLSRLRSGVPLLLASGGVQVVQMIWNEDVAEAVIRVVGNAKTFGQVYNCVHPKAITAQRYYELIAECLGVRIQIEEVRSDAILASHWGWGRAVFSRIADATSLMQDLDFVPPTNPYQAIANCLDSLGKKMTNLTYEDYLQPIRSTLHATKQTLIKSLDLCAQRRPRLEVDVRMNRDPLPNLLS